MSRPREDAVAVRCGTCGRGLRCVPDPAVGQTVVALRWCHRCPHQWHTQNRVTVTNLGGRVRSSWRILSAYQEGQR